MKLWNKFLVLRRDGTVPDWPYLVLGARDPAAPHALRAYGNEAARLGMDMEYVNDIHRLADDFEKFRREHGDGDPDASPHRQDDPAIVSQLKWGSTPPSRGEKT
jgi:hypothetical protein